MTTAARVRIRHTTTSIIRSYTFTVDPTPHTRPDGITGTVRTVAVFLDTLNGREEPATLVATLVTDLGSDIICTTGEHLGPNDDPQLLDLFGSLVDEARTLDQARQFAIGIAAPRPTPAVPVPPFHDVDAPGRAIINRTLPDGTVQPYAVAVLHRCQHGNQVHTCGCAAGTDHTARICMGHL